MTITSKILLSVALAMSVAPAVAADLRVAAPAAVIDRCARVEPAPGTPSVPGGDIFGFTSPTDIGDPCSWAFASEHSGGAGKRDGSYLALASKHQLGYTFSDRIAVAVSAFTAYTTWSGVAVAQDALAELGVGGLNRLHFDGFSGEIMLRLLARSPGQPFALTISAEPRWSRVDGLTGWRAEGYGNEFKLFLDVALTDWLFGAINLNYALATARYDLANAPWVDTSATSVSGALTAQLYAAEKRFVEGVFLGIEGRYLSAFNGLTLDQHVGNALFAGPTLAIAFEGGRMLNVVWTPQIAGQALPASAPGRLDLDNYERHQFRVKFATALP